MIQIEQRRLWRPDDHPDGPQSGDCGAACVASIFGVPYEECDRIDGTYQSIAEWTRARYPGIAACSQMLGDGWQEVERIGDHVNWPTRHHESGYWMATIWSPRIPDTESFDCGCAYDENNQPKAADPDCRWCHGEPHKRSMGITWGLHAVVMRNGVLAWDPHPERDASATLYFRSATTWRVDDPSLLRAT